MKTRHVDVATSPHAPSSAPNIFFSILLLPEESNLKEFTKKYEKDSDFYFIQGKRNQGRRTKNRETSRSQGGSRTDCSLCSFRDYELCRSPYQSELCLQGPPSRQSNPSSNYCRSIVSDRMNQAISNQVRTAEIECQECNNNCIGSKNYQMTNPESADIMQEENEEDLMRRNSEIIREEMLMRDSIRKELIKSLSNEPTYEGCFKKSIPCLITPAAVIFCLLNFFIPGSGIFLDFSS